MNQRGKLWTKIPSNNTIYTTKDLIPHTTVIDQFRSIANRLIELNLNLNLELSKLYKITEMYPKTVIQLWTNGKWEMIFHCKDHA